MQRFEQQSDEKVQLRPEGLQVQLAPFRLQTFPSRGSLMQFFEQQSELKVQRWPVGLQVQLAPFLLQTLPIRGSLTQCLEQQSEPKVQRAPLGAQPITIGAVSLDSLEICEGGWLKSRHWVSRAIVKAFMDPPVLVFPDAVVLNVGRNRRGDYSIPARFFAISVSLRCTTACRALLFSERH